MEGDESISLQTRRLSTAREEDPPVTTETVARANPVELAVIWVEKGRKGNDRWTDDCPQAQLEIYRFRKRLKPLFWLLKVGFLLLSVFEKPSWCLDVMIKCANERKGMENSNLPILPVEVSTVLEILFLFSFVARLWLRHKSLGDIPSLGNWQKAAIVLVALSLMDSFVSIFNTIGLGPTQFRISRLCRPLIFLVFTKPVRLTLGRVVKAIPHFVDVLVSLGLCVILFVWIGLILFARTPEGYQQFASFDDAFASVWILFTTANFPDVMIPAYNDQRLSFFFFLAYLILSLYLLNNVLLATIVDAYKEQLKISAKGFYKRRRNAIDNAFALLADSSGIITLERWTEFFYCYCDPKLGVVGANDPLGASYNLQRGNFVFQMLDTDCNRGLALEEFRLITNVFSDMRIPRRRPPDLSNRSWARMLQRFLLKGMRVGRWRLAWDSLVDCIILVDMAITLVATIVFVTPLDGGRFAWVWTYDQIWYWIAFSFSCFYFLEILMKICIIGPERFWNRRPVRNRCDLFIVCFLFGGECIYLLLVPGDNFVRALVLLRILRSLRLVEHVRPLEHLATLLLRLVPVYWNMGHLLVIIYYIYSTVGEQLFGGLIEPSAEALKGSPFAESHYWALNFNDFSSGLVTLFCLMVVNNWFVIADGYLRVTGSNWTAIFFVSFFIVSNLVVLNMLLALILDCSSNLRDELEKLGQGQVEPTASMVSDHFRRQDTMHRMLLADEDFDFAPEVSLPASGGRTQLPAPERSVVFRSMGGGQHVRGRTLSH